MANIKIAYGASATITISPENVASSGSFVAGVESGVIDNTSNLYVTLSLADSGPPEQLQLPTPNV